MNHRKVRPHNIAESSPSPYPTLTILLAGLTLLMGEQSFADIRFQEISSAAGIMHAGPSFGASWGDFDGDGFPDLWVGNHFTKPSLYLNLGDGRFSEITDQVWSGFPTRDAHGAAWADFDRDGDQDLIEVGGGGAPNRLFVNNGMRFEDMAAQFGIVFPDARSRTPLWVDWNRDGWLDLILTQALGATAPPLAVQSESSHFVDATDIVGLARVTASYAQLTSWFANESTQVAIQGPRFPQALYDIADIPFTDTVLSLGLPPQGGAAAADTFIGDTNGDLQDDLFITKQGADSQVAQPSPTRLDFKIPVASRTESALQFATSGSMILGIFPYFGFALDSIYIGANGIHPHSFSLELSPTDPVVHGHFPHQAGVDDGIFIGFDALEQKWTIAVTSLTTQFFNFSINAAMEIRSVEAINFDPNPPPQWPHYFVQDASQQWSEQRIAAGLGFGMPCFSVVGADFDNDTDIDLFLACTRPVANSQNILLENMGDGTFATVGSDGGAGGSDEGRSESVVVADYDEDGLVDLFVTNGEGRAPFNTGPNQLFRNISIGNNWIEIDLKGRISNPQGVGARIVLDSNGKSQVRRADGGMHRYSQNQQRIHFGLGDAETIDSVTIEWPVGIAQTVIHPQINQVLQIIETGTTSCSDGVDNDNDGEIDYPNDTDCTGWDENNEGGTGACDNMSGLPDSDGDGIGNECDNCTEIPNATQCDTDGDGFGNHCDADLDQNNIVNQIDLGMLRSVFGTQEPTPADLDCNGIVNQIDLGRLRNTFGKMPGPSAFSL